MTDQGPGGRISYIVLKLLVLIGRAVAAAKGTHVPVNNQIDSREFDSRDETAHGDASLLGRQP